MENESRFRAQEEDRREGNADNKSKEKPFVSHSWRDVSTQEKKRRIIDFLSKPAEGENPHICPCILHISLS